jgi:class 3 adenylate cyclase
MRLRSEQLESRREQRFDTRTAGKIAALATRLQQRHGDTLSADELEAIGAEVGLHPDFIRQACECATPKNWPAVQQSAPPAQRAAPRVQRFSLPTGRELRALVGAWWAAAWALPFIFMFALGFMFDEGLLFPIGFFLGLATYIGGGVFLSNLAEEDKKAPSSDQKLSRAQLLDTLFALQQTLENQKQPCAFLSVDVVDSSEMKRLAPDLAVEYSFRQFHQWVEEVVRAEGGELQSAAGDGVMCVFPTNGAALRTARRLQEGIGVFNTARNRLSTPFRIRCGASAGAVAIEEGVPLGHLQSAVIDRAAARQKRAAPGDVVVGAELAEAGLQELGNLSRLPEPIDGEPAFSWRAALPGS